MKNALFILFFIGCCTCFSKANAQSTFRDGYIITLSNDTLIGQLDYPAGVLQAQSVKFRKTKQDDFIEYSPGQILAFHAYGRKYYFSNTLPVGEDQKLVFAEALVIGKASLFKYKNRFYVEKDDTLKIEVRQEVRQLKIEDKKGVRTDIIGKGALIYLLSDCLIDDEISSFDKLSERKITNIIITYNKCKGNPFQELKNDQPWTSFELRLGIGVAVSRLHFANNTRQTSPVTESPFRESYAPAFSAMLNISSPRISERASLQTGLLYSEHYYFSEFIIEKYSYAERHDIHIRNKVLKVPVSFQYSSTYQKFAPYFNIGGSFNKQFNPKARWNREIEAGQVVRTYETEPVYTPAAYLGMWGGLGARFALFKGLTGFLEVRYEKGMHPFRVSEALENNSPSNVSDVLVLVGIKL